MACKGGRKAWPGQTATEFSSETRASDCLVVLLSTCKCPRQLPEAIVKKLAGWSSGMTAQTQQAGPATCVGKKDCNDDDEVPASPYFGRAHRQFD